MKVHMAEKKHFTYEIQYTKAAEKFFRAHENIRDDYEASIKELLAGEHPERVNVKRIKGKKTITTGSGLAAIG